MSVDQLQPKPRPGEFTSPVNINELNRILRKIQLGLAKLEAQAPVQETTGQETTTASKSASLTPQPVDDTLDWVL